MVSRLKRMPLLGAGSRHHAPSRRVRTERPVYLLAEVPNVDIDHVRAVLVLVVPSPLEQLEPGKNVAGTAHEGLEQRELLPREGDLGLAPPNPVRRGIEPEVADREDRGPLDGATSGDRAQTGQQLVEREGLREVIVRPAVEPCDAVLDRIAGREHQHRSPYAAVTQPATGLEAIQARQHDVEYDRVVLRRLRHPEGVLAADGDVGGEPLLSQAAADEHGHLHVVLDDQHSHLGKARRHS
jgi:hypothetical protein